MVKHEKSWWGIKQSGEDIAQVILDVIENANHFIVVGGYNFTFKTSAGSRPFFDALEQKINDGIPVMMMFPPRLFGKYNPQPTIINHCMNIGIGVIINPQNHSKWLLTDYQIYYGSSNFTNASWKDKVEVVSLHDHGLIPLPWSKSTIKDFYDFLVDEIKTLTSPTRKMKSYRGLLTATRLAWLSIKPMVKKLNPSIDKVIDTLSNYDNVQAILKEQIAYWFDFYDKNYFEIIFRLSINISGRIDDLCEYAYAYIYNETTSGNDTVVLPDIVDKYNELHKEVNETIDEALNGLPDINNESMIESQIAISNINRLSKMIDTIEEKLNLK